MKDELEVSPHIKKNILLYIQVLEVVHTVSY